VPGVGIGSVEHIDVSNVEIGSIERIHTLSVGTSAGNGERIIKCERYCENGISLCYTDTK
jgi:hypothetical protein